MRKLSGMKSAVFLYGVFVLLLVGMILVAAVYTTHISTIIRPDGEVSDSSWPQQYAESFSKYISVENNVPKISANGMSSLDRNQLWVQILDEQGAQIAQHHKPTDIPNEYAISAPLESAASSRMNEYTVSIISFAKNGRKLRV
ncbi:MAG: hypothetical protein GX096_10185 [Clostridiales bacterium]|nr:hypothetical protein [Clostridiales bacterium]